MFIIFFSSERKLICTYLKWNALQIKFKNCKVVFIFVSCNTLCHNRESALNRYELELFH